MNASQPIKVAAVYKFASVDDIGAIRAPLKSCCEDAEVKGILLIAHEGINGTIAGSRDGIDMVLSYIRAIPGFAELDVKTSYAEENPFLRIRVREKREIVTMGVDGVDPNKNVGTYVDPEGWNELISDPDVMVIDTRNDYEVEIGTFERALNPKTKTFREFPNWIREQLGDKSREAGRPKIAMFCTGGIRCEKATAFMREQGFDEVYHLKGGILKYLEKVPADESLWQGECFVFDRRVSVGHGLKPGPYKLCSVCREPVLSADNIGGGFAEQICEACITTAPESKKRRAKARQQQIKLAKQRGTTHLGPRNRQKKDPQ